MQNVFARTDLAAEANGRLSTEENGIKCKSLTLGGMKAELISVTTDDAARKIGKPHGNYYTLYMEEYVNRRAVSFPDGARAVAELLRRIPAVNSGKSFLIACLGNRAVTPDALGPLTADGILVTRHLKSSLPDDFAAFSEVSVIKTGVLGTTGIESAEEIRAVCRDIRPDCVIAVDALATGDFARLCRNIQICDTGISPGAGVGNDRAAVNEAFLGVPVVAVGVPTVIDASAFSEHELARGLFVTPRNIDELVASTAKLVAYGIDLALHPHLSVSDVDLLVE